MKKKLAELDKILKKHRTILIVAHDYPDPDAIASAMLLAYLARKRHRMRTRIAYGGHISRAENRAMVQELGIMMTHTDKIRWQRYRCIAMVDTQAQFGNHSLPKKVQPTIVIDHHSAKGQTSIPFEDIRSDYGASATMLLEYLQAADLDPTVDLATAVTYAIRSETQELGRDTFPSDIDAYMKVYPKANKRKLANISTPKLPRSYFFHLQKALQNAKVFRNVAHTNLGEVESPEFVAQIADMLLRHERITWSLATGRFDQRLFVSLRCSHANAKAGKILAQIVGRSGTAGGHAMVAGGQIPIDENGEWESLESKLATRFLEKMKYDGEVEWKSLLNKSED